MGIRSGVAQTLEKHKRGLYKQHGGEVLVNALISNGMGGNEATSTPEHMQVARLAASMPVSTQYYEEPRLDERSCWTKELSMYGGSGPRMAPNEMLWEARLHEGTALPLLRHTRAKVACASTSAISKRHAFQIFGYPSEAGLLCLHAI